VNAALTKALIPTKVTKCIVGYLRINKQRALGITPLPIFLTLFNNKLNILQIYNITQNYIILYRVIPGLSTHNFKN
jgi:hypothetical protein